MLLRLGPTSPWSSASRTRRRHRDRPALRIVDRSGSLQGTEENASPMGVRSNGTAVPPNLAARRLGPVPQGRGHEHHTLSDHPSQEKAARAAAALIMIDWTPSSPTSHLVGDRPDLSSSVAPPERGRPNASLRGWRIARRRCVEPGSSASRFPSAATRPKRRASRDVRGSSHPIPRSPGASPPVERHRCLVSDERRLCEPRSARLVSPAREEVFVSTSTLVPPRRLAPRAPRPRGSDPANGDHAETAPRALWTHGGVLHCARTPPSDFQRRTPCMFPRGS